MDKQLIKNELIRRVSQRIGSSNVNYAKGLNKLKAISANLKGTPDFAKRITEEMNQILKENNVTFTESEKNEFMTFIKPTIGELIRKQMLH